MSFQLYFFTIVFLASFPMFSLSFLFFSSISIFSCSAFGSSLGNISPFFPSVMYSLMLPTGVTIGAIPQAIASIVARLDVSVRLGSTNMSIACKNGTMLSCFPVLIIVFVDGISSSSPSPTISSFMFLFFLRMFLNAFTSVGRFFSLAILPVNPIIFVFGFMFIFFLASFFDFAGLNFFMFTPKCTTSFLVFILFSVSRSSISLFGAKSSVHLLYSFLALFFTSIFASHLNRFIALLASSHSTLCM